jgi:hypothetical protein
VTVWKNALLPFSGKKQGMEKCYGYREKNGRDWGLKRTNRSKKSENICGAPKVVLQE